MPAVEECVVLAWAGAEEDAVIQDGLVAVLDPVLCSVACPLLALPAVVPVEGRELVGGELKLPRSAIGAIPLLAVDECSTVVVSGCDAA